MNTEEIYTAQLNVSKYFTDETIKNLIDALSYLGDTSYNIKTRTIDIKRNDKPGVLEDSNIRNTIREWIRSLPADQKDIDIICNNIEFIFNIAKLEYPNLITKNDMHVIVISLY